MGNKILLLKDVRIKIEFSELSQKKDLYDNDTFLKTSVNGESNFIRRPKRPNTESSETAGLSRTFSHNLHERTTGL